MERCRQLITIVQITLDEPIRRHRRPVAFAQIVVNPNIVALLPQQLRPACEPTYPAPPVSKTFISNCTPKYLM